MKQSYPYLVTSRPASGQPPISGGSSDDLIAFRYLSDKASLLRPLQDKHLLEVYREAKKMNLSSEFIELLEDAIAMRKLDPLKEA